MNWTKMPSVMTGGKPFFYTAISSSNIRYWISWSRHDQSWAVSSSIPGSRADSGFRTAKAAMHFAESCLAIATKD